MVSVGGADWTLICVVYNQVGVALLAVARALVVVVEATFELLVLGAVGAVECALPGGLLPGAERGALQQELYSLGIRCRSGDRLAGDGSGCCQQQLSSLCGEEMAAIASTDPYGRPPIDTACWHYIQLKQYRNQSKKMCPLHVCKRSDPIIYVLPSSNKIAEQV